MSFDWISFLDSSHIHYVTSGPNVSRGNVAAHCPFCGSADPSQHMSINIESKGWRCFRNRDHSGKSPVRLVQALLGTTYERAEAIVNSSTFIPDDFMGAVMRKLSPPPEPERKTRLRIPKEFRRIEYRAASKRYTDYLEGPTRLYTRRQIETLTDNYDMYYCTEGKQRGRVVFLVKFKGKLMTWTGRTIYSQEELRYKTLSADPEIEEHPAHGPINNYLLWYDDIMANADDCHTLVLCEGPFDALRVNVLGGSHGIVATCCFTATPSALQIDLLHDTVGVYKRRCLLLDRGTLGTAMRQQALMSSLNMHVLSLPANVKDPGLLDETSLLKTIH